MHAPGPVRLLICGCDLDHADEAGVGADIAHQNLPGAGAGRRRPEPVEGPVGFTAMDDLPACRPFSGRQPSFPRTSLTSRTRLPQPRGAEIVESLRAMFAHQRANCFQLDDDSVETDEVRPIALAQRETFVCEPQQGHGLEWDGACLELDRQTFLITNSHSGA